MTTGAGDFQCTAGKELSPNIREIRSLGDTWPRAAEPA